jgi:hypothetical protein
MVQTQQLLPASVRYRTSSRTSRQRDWWRRKIGSSSEEPRRMCRRSDYRWVFRNGNLDTPCSGLRQSHHVRRISRVIEKGSGTHSRNFGNRAVK